VPEGITFSHPNLQEAHDADFEAALIENIVIVEKQKRQIIFLQSLISAHAHVPTPASVPPSAGKDQEEDESPGVYL
jgi:hypothetical protein